MRRVVRLEYDLKSNLVFIYDRAGDVLKFFVNGVDRSHDGDAIYHGEIAVAEAGFNIQADISAAFDEENRAKDDCQVDKGRVELELERKAGA